MATYTLKIWYAASADHSPQIHSGLSEDQVEEYVRPEVGFLHDMIELGGKGVRRMSLEVER